MKDCTFEPETVDYKAPRTAWIEGDGTEAKNTMSSIEGFLKVHLLVVRT